MPFVDDLERELRNAAAARERKPARRPLAFTFAPAAGLAAVLAVLLVVALSREGTDEAPLRPPEPPQRLTGDYRTVVASGDWKGDWELLIRDGAARLIGIVNGASESLTAGHLTYAGDRVTFRVDLARSRNDPWPEPICARRRRDTAGTYEILDLTPESFRLRKVADPCTGRARILTAGTWRR